MNKDNIKRILVITLSNTGDVILTTPVIEALSRAHPDARIDIVVGPNGREVFEKNTRISKVFIYDKHSGIFEKFRLIKKLRKIRYNLAIDLKNTAIPFLISAKYKSKSIGRKKGLLHKREEHLDILKPMGIETEGIPLKIELSDDDIRTAEGLLKSIKGGYVVVSPGAKSHTKRWPPEYFGGISDLINERLGYEIVLVGKDDGNHPDSDRVVTDHVKRYMKNAPLDLIGKTTLRELGFIIKKALLLVTNDSAPLHIGSAVNTPTVAIFGPTDERKYGPLADKSIVLRKNLECAPCEKAQCRYNYECMRQITVNDAYEAVNKILKFNDK